MPLCCKCDRFSLVNTKCKQGRLEPLTIDLGLETTYRSSKHLSTLRNKTHGVSKLHEHGILSRDTGSESENGTQNN